MEYVTSFRVGRVPKIMTFFEVTQTIVCLHITCGILWFVYYMGDMLTNPCRRNMFNLLVIKGTINGTSKYSANFVRFMLILTAFLSSLLFWEVSAIRTFKRSYKNFLPKKLKGRFKRWFQIRGGIYNEWIWKNT